MPYKWDTDKKLIPKKYDKRVKLLPEDKENIRFFYAEGSYSQRQLARIYNVSRRTIQFIVDPNQLKANLERRKERGGSQQYYDKEKNTEYAKKHRVYKNQLNKENKLIDNNN